MTGSVDLAAKATRLRALHIPGDPVILPNAWDAASALTFSEAGFEAIATSSAAMARALGYEDGQQTPPDEMFAAIGRLTRAVDAPVTADIERGYGLEPAEIVERLAGAGAVGCNLEDSDPLSEGMIPIEEQAEWLAAIRSAAEDAEVPIVVNARVDVHLREVGAPQARLDAAIARGRRYLAAGADCVYPIFLTEPDELARFVDGAGGSVNAVFLPGASTRTLAASGVARISFGSGLQQAMLGSLARRARLIKAGEDPYPS